MKPVKTKLTKTRKAITDKLPSWLSLEDIVFLSAATFPEIDILVKGLLASKSSGIYIQSNTFGKIPKLRQDLALIYFDLAATGMLAKLADRSWQELVREEIDEYSMALMTIANNETLSKAKMLRQLSENKKLSIQNSRSEDELVLASDVKKTFSRYCAEVNKVIDEIVETLPAKLDGAGENEVDEVLLDFVGKAKKRLMEMEL